MTGPGQPGHLLRVATAAVLGVTLLAGCTDDATELAPPGEYKAPGKQSAVADPTARDAVLGPAATPAPVDSPEQPNLLMITMDDASLKDMQFMPHLQELVADTGVTLERGLAPTPICVPARASLLTGQYSSNHGAVTVGGEGGGYAAFRDADTLPVALQEAGYDTMLVGKYLNGYTAQEVHRQPPGWSVWRPTVDFSTYNFAHPEILVDGKIVKTDTYSTTLLSDHSNELIRSHADTDKPWYQWVNYVAPHHGGPKEDDDPEGLSTTVPEDRDRDTFSDLDLDETPEMFEKDPSDKGLVSATRRPASADRRAGLREVRQQRVESLQAVDRAIERTIETLRSTDQLDNTYVVVTSDNGFFVGEHNLYGKLWYFRDGLTIPMFISGPGLPRGTTSAAPVTNADWAPTFARLAGAELGREVDGVDVMPWIDSNATRRVVPLSGYPVKGGLEPLYTGVSVGEWTYVRGRRGRGEMYNSRTDPHQLSNLYRDPRFTEQRKQLRKLWKESRECVGAACPKEFME